jgi:hypothetical protein
MRICARPSRSNSNSLLNFKDPIQGRRGRWRYATGGSFEASLGAPRSPHDSPWQGVRVGLRFHLHRRQPQREVAGVVLRENAEEALQRAEDGAMDHNGAALLLIAVVVRQVEPLRQVEIHLAWGAGIRHTVRIPTHRHNDAYEHTLHAELHTPPKSYHLHRPRLYSTHGSRLLLHTRTTRSGLCRSSTNVPRKQFGTHEASPKEALCVTQGYARRT